eukprot:TRINITY_DN2882_c0_g1_i1.p1 TRINITY_DN2882_c0_g1~~TRINITY_DN2882_c0_g1_i1.p1  ORF type:complete len:348 (+),score=91.78 TRINITY_DN2882_c0_g1_i1:54-1097(+)
MERVAARMGAVAGLSVMGRYWRALRRGVDRRRRLTVLSRAADSMAAQNNRVRTQHAWLSLRAHLAHGKARELCSLCPPPDAQEREETGTLRRTPSMRSSALAGVSVPDAAALAPIMTEAWSALNALQRVIHAHSVSPVAETECTAACRNVLSTLSSCEVRMQEQQQACVQLLQMSRVFENAVWCKTRELAERNRVIEDLQRALEVQSTQHLEVLRKAQTLQSPATTEHAPTSPQPQTARSEGSADTGPPTPSFGSGWRQSRSSAELPCGLRDHILTLTSTQKMDLWPQEIVVDDLLRTLTAHRSEITDLKLQLSLCVTGDWAQKEAARLNRIQSDFRAQLFADGLHG